VIENRLNLRREAARLAPQGLLAAWYLFGVMPSHHGVSEGRVYGTVIRKLLALASPWVRFPLVWEWPLLIGLALSLLLLVLRALPALKSQSLRTLLRDDLVLAVFLLGTAYVLLPQGTFDTWDVDVRILPFLVYFLFLWFASLQPCTDSSRAGAGPSNRPAIVLLITCWISLLVLLVQLWPYNREIHAYWELLRRIPEHKVVLPVSTRPYLGRISPTLHQGALYAAFNEGVVPTIPSRDNLGALFFFGFRQRYESPGSLWYVRNLPPDWRQMRMACDYWVVSKPFDPARLPYPRAPVFLENETAVVFDMSPK
jgi:hypothetical protein